MINTHIAFNKLKKLLFAGMNFTDIKLKDGTLIQYEGELKEGTEVYIINEDATTSLAEDKDYELEDGTKISTVAGKVTMITPKEEEVAVAEEMASEEVVIEPVVETPSATIEDRVSAIESKLAEILDALNKDVVEDKLEDPAMTEMIKLKEEFSAIKELVNIIADKPIEPTKIIQKTNFSELKLSNLEEKQRLIREAIKNAK
jgi:hypothetical protein